MSHHYDLSAMLASAVSRAGSATLPFALLKEFANEIQTAFLSEIIYVGELSNDGARQIIFVAPPSRRQAILDEVARCISGYTGQQRSRENSGSSHLKAISAEVLPGVQLLILIDLPDATDELQECAEVAADLYRRSLLSVFRKHATGRQLLAQFLVSLQTATTAAEAVNILASDGTAILCCRRIAICRRTAAGTWKLIAATSVAQPNDRSAAAQQLSDMVTRAECQAQTGEQSSSSQETAQKASAAPVSADSDVIAQVLPLAMNGQWQGCEYAFVCEWDPGQQPDQDLVTSLVLAASSILDSIDLRTATFWTHFRRKLNRKAGLRKIALLCIVAVATTALLFPVDFTIEARGELEPSVRQFIWAAENGIVSEIFPDDGDTLDTGSLILKLRNDELSVQMESLQGEIATSRTRLAAVESQRVGGEASRDPQLTAEHSEVAARVEALERQLVFLKTRLGNLEIRSPIRGKLFGSSMKERFLGRPITRGQYFCEVAEMDSSWELRLRVSEADIDHLMTSADASEGKPRVTFSLATRPGEYATVTVSSIARTTELDPSGVLFTEVIASMPETPSGTERPGTGVTGRIHCGKRSLGYVCFRHISEYLSQKLFL